MKRKRTYIGGYEVSWNAIGYDWLRLPVCLIVGATITGILLAIFYPNI
jgi:hypothetical protein